MSYDFGNKIKCTVFGQSHSESIGAIIEGFPAGFKIDIDHIKEFMARRAPGNDTFSTQRKESDDVNIISGINNGVTCGSTICGIINNNDIRSKDYSKVKTLPRPGHSDYSAYIKYDGQNDIRGGGQFSGRMTAPLCFAGALCIQLLKQYGIDISSHIYQIGNIKDKSIDLANPDIYAMKQMSKTTFPVLFEKAKIDMLNCIEEARLDGDSVGGIVECFATGVKAGIGGPLSEGVEGELAKNLFGIPAVKGIEFGIGFNCAQLNGSQNNDQFDVVDNKIITTTNNCGGILGGITNGMPISFRVAFKPTPSIKKPQQTVNLETYEREQLIIEGRHDPCIVPRAVPVVEAVTAITLAGLLI